MDRPNDPPVGPVRDRDGVGATASTEQEGLSRGRLVPLDPGARGARPGRPGGPDPGRRRGPDRRRRSRPNFDGMVATYIDAVSTLDPHSPAFNDKVRDIAKLGDDDIRASASVSNRLLEKPLAAMQRRPDRRRRR